MTSKQRAYLRSLANTMEPIIHVGKDGVNENMIKQASDALEARELAEAIDRFLRTLPERECSIFLRRYWYIDSVQDIAARYALRENTAKSILFRTREKLRRYLAGEGILV